MRSLMDVVDQLHGEFGAARARTVILTVAEEYRDELATAAADVKPALLEHLSRQRLLGEPPSRHGRQARVAPAVAPPVLDPVHDSREPEI